MSTSRIVTDSGAQRRGDRGRFSGSAQSVAENVGIDRVILIDREIAAVEAAASQQIQILRMQREAAVRINRMFGAVK